MTTLTRTKRAIIVILILMVIFSFVAVINLNSRVEDIIGAQNNILEYIGGGR